jgi:aspartate ammonia-lyase
VSFLVKGKSFTFSVYDMELDGFMKTRVETDFLGRKPVPENAYYGIQTARAVENFLVSGLRAPVVFVRAYVLARAAGLGEIELPAVQPGSSIMPGKVNPVLAECMNMIGFQVIANDLAVSMAVQAGQLDLNVMMLVMMHNVLQSIELLTNFLPVFTQKCVQGIKVDKKKCASYVEANPSLAVFLSRRIGYLKASQIAAQALKERRSVKQLAIEKKLLIKGEAEQMFSAELLLGKRRKSAR